MPEKPLPEVGRLKTRLPLADMPIDMAELRFFYPVVRFGRVCEIDAEISRAESLSIANKIAEKWKGFDSALRSVWDDFGGRVALRDQSSRTDEFQRTPVVRLPRHRVVREDYELSGRAYVAVCCGGKRSKLWYRLAVVKPTDLPALELSRFLEDANQIASAVTSALIPVYAEFLSRGTPQPTFDLVVSAANSAQNPVRHVLGQLESGKFEDVERALADSAVVEVLEPFLRVCGYDTSALPATRKPEGNEVSSGLQVGRSGDQPSLFQNVVTRDPDVTRLTGLVHANRHRFDETTPSLVVTADLVRDIAEFF